MQFQCQPSLDSSMITSALSETKNLLVATQDPVLIIPKCLAPDYQRKMKGNSRNSSEEMD